MTKSANSHISLRLDQVERMRKSSAPMSAIIASAVYRFEHHEFLVEKTATKRASRNTGNFVSIHIRNRPDYSDAKIRAILDAHFAKPRDYSREIARLERDIAQLRANTGIWSDNNISTILEGKQDEN